MLDIRFWSTWERNWMICDSSDNIIILLTNNLDISNIKNFITTLKFHFWKPILALLLLSCRRIELIFQSGDRCDWFKFTLIIWFNIKWYIIFIDVSLLVVTIRCKERSVVNQSRQEPSHHRLGKRGANVSPPISKYFNKKRVPSGIRTHDLPHDSPRRYPLRHKSLDEATHGICLILSWKN